MFHYPHTSHGHIQGPESVMPNGIYQSQCTCYTIPNVVTIIPLHMVKKKKKKGRVSFRKIISKETGVPNPSSFYGYYIE